MLTKNKAVIDLAYGDSGKGILVARLAAKVNPQVVVRFSGGCQAAHNVITNDGRHHTFAQFGSATFAQIPTYISRFMMFEPFSLEIEARNLERLNINRAMTRLISVAWNAYMTTPYHWLLNQHQEDARGDGRHGSTGRGIGTTAWYASLHPDLAPIAHDLLYPAVLAHKLTMLRAWAIENGLPDAEDLPTVAQLMMRYEPFSSTLHIVGTEVERNLLLDHKLIFEGSQGVLLDEHVGFFPHVTRSVTTDENIQKLYGSYGEDAADYVENIGVIRAYTTRHGHGPFVAEDNTLDLPESHNRMAHFQGGWRVGHLDLPAIAYAAKAVRVDGLYITHMDAIKPGLQVAMAYKNEHGTPWNPSVLPRDDFAGREKQTQALSASTPVLVPYPESEPAETISGLLNIPLVGTAYGPRVADDIKENA